VELKNQSKHVTIQLTQPASAIHLTRNSNTGRN